MNFKFTVGQAVEYTPRGGTAGLFTVVRQMPEELQAFDLKYLIKNQGDGCERTVFECDLSASEKAHDQYVASIRLRNTSRH